MEEENYSVFEECLEGDSSNSLFVWTKPKEGFSINSEDIICEGRLSDYKGGRVLSPVYFIAPKDLLVRCEVYF